MTIGFLRVVVRHPVLAAEAVRLAVATSSPRWLRTFPFIPRPAPAYRDWRLVTAYGRDDHPPSQQEIVEFLRWRRRLRRIR